MIRVLFVDDEPKVLRGLERMLSDVECDWETEFAQSGREALERFAAKPFDVVVSDMRMPEMDGAALLQEVKQRYPDAVRIVLSGQAERESVLRAMGATHQYLAKPCDPDTLRDCVARAIHLRKILNDPLLRSLVSQLSRIPSAPRLYQDLMAGIQDPKKSLGDLGRIVARDIGMTAKILQVVNSAFFGLPCHISDPVHAVCLLGLDVLHTLVMTVHVFSALAMSGLGDLGLEELWDHSAETGAIAKCIASMEGCKRHVCDHALMAGLLHDTGKLILAANQESRYRKARLLVTERGMAPLEAEREVFGTTHAEVGAYLLGLWGLPDLTVEAVAFHHRPADCAATAMSPLLAVHAADALSHARHAREGEQPLGRLDEACLERLGLTQRWPVWQEQCLAGANR